METGAAATSQGRDWSSLPADLLVQILRWLRWSSHPSFALACRHWRTAVSPFYPASITPLLLNATDVGSTNVRYYSPYFHKNLEVVGATLEAPGAKIYCATGRHLTLALPHLIVNAQLGTGGGTIDELPPIARIGFDFVVYDGASRMLGVDATVGLLAALAIRSGDGSWGDWDITRLGPDFLASPACNPVFHGGLLYVLGQDGMLAVYDHGRGFEILEKPLSLGFKWEQSYLAESDQGDLMAVLIGHRGTTVIVIRLNERAMEWEKVENLEGRALFTGALTTVVKKTNVKWMQNKVFLPRLYDWPETIYVDLVQRDGELAFVPKLMGGEYARVKDKNSGTSMWSYELGQEEDASEFWGTERVDYSIWVDFSSSC